MFVVFFFLLNLPRIKVFLKYQIDFAKIIEELIFCGFLAAALAFAGGLIFPDIYSIAWRRFFMWEMRKTRI